MDDFDDKEPTFSFYDFKKWLAKNDNELKQFLDESAEIRKEEKKENLKEKFKKRVKDKIEKKRKK